MSECTNPSLHEPIVDERNSVEPDWPIEFHVKSSEWTKMSAKTKAALVEVVKAAAKQFAARTLKANP